MPNLTAPRNSAHTMRELEEWSLIGLFALTLASAGLGWGVSGHALRPVRDITEAARRASERHLGERINLHGPDDELKELADTFDDMLERLDVAFAAQRQFVANTSRELRTPLTSMRTAIDVALAKPNRTTEQLEATAEKVRRSIDRAERTVDALLTLAVSNQGTTDMEPLDLATEVEDALDGLAAQSRTSGLRVDQSCPRPRCRAARCCSNAWWPISWRMPSSTMSLPAGSEYGPAPPAAAPTSRWPTAGPWCVRDLPHLFEPFHRADSRVGSSGVGLGLSIVQSVGEAHGARIQALASAGGGLVVTVTMPARSPA